MRNPRSGRTDRPIARSGPVVAVATTLVALAVLALSACGGSPAAETTAPTATEPGTTSTTTAPTTTVAPSTASTASTLPPMPEPSPPLPSPGDNRVLVIGDSVILGAATDVPAELVGWKVLFDARESRFINNSLAVLKQHKADVDGVLGLDRAKVEQAYADAGKPPPPAPPPLSVPEALGRVVVIHLCTNYQAGGGFDTYIDSLMDYLDGVDRVVWVTCGEWSEGQTEANQAIRDAATRHPAIVVADWAVHAAGPGFTYEDGIHLTETGRTEIAALVARAVGPAPEPLPAPAPTTLPRPTTTTTTTEPPVEEAPPT